MKDDAHPTKRYGGQGNVHKLLTPEMRQQVVQLKQQLEEYAAHLGDLCHNLEVINDAVFRAQDIAECLLEDDPFEAWDAIKSEKQAADTPADEVDWQPYDLD
jgi:hypothetical protein